MDRLAMPRYGSFLISLFLILTLTLSLGCGEKRSGKLQGSVGTVYDLSFDQVRARHYTSELAIEYHRDNGEVPVRITLRHSVEEEIVPGTHDIAEAGDITGRSRGVEIPRIISGTLRLESYEPSEGTLVKGSFEAILRSGDDRLTISGEFEAPLEIVLYGYPTIDAGHDASDAYLPPRDTSPLIPDTPAPVEDTAQPEPDLPLPEPDVAEPEPDIVVVEDISTEPDVVVEDVSTDPDIIVVEDISTEPDVVVVEDVSTEPDTAADVSTEPDVLEEPDTLTDADGG